MLRQDAEEALPVLRAVRAVIQFGLYASDDYLVRMGTPDFALKGQGHALVAAGTGMGTTIVDSGWLPPLIGRARIAARTNGRLGMAALAAAGIGIACLPRSLGDATPGLRLLPTPKPSPRRQLWMGVHRSARAVPRMRTVVDHLIDAFGRLSKTLDPARGARAPASATGIGGLPDGRTA